MNRTFDVEQTAALQGLIDRWLEIASEAEQLAKECPAKDVRLAMERKAVHYRDCANDLSNLIDTAKCCT